MSRYITRYGQPIPPDEVYDASISKDIPRMIKALRLKTNLVDRHFLLLTLGEEAYKKRDEDQYRSLFIKVVKQHLDEFPKIAVALRKDFNGILPRVPTFQKFVILMTKLEEYEEAIDACKLALYYDLEDTSKGGFAERLEKIKKKQDSFLKE